MHKKEAIALLALLFFGHIAPAAKPPYTGKPVPQVLTGRCTRVVDGDTIEITVQSQRFTVRLFGIDSPEEGQPGFFEAKRFTTSLLLGQEVTVRGEHFDQYGRLVGRVYRGITNIGVEIVEHGHAWHDPAYAYASNLVQAQATAQLLRLGLWREPSPIPPWEWRWQDSLREKRVQPRIIMTGPPRKPMRPRLTLTPELSFPQPFVDYDFSLPSETDEEDVACQPEAAASVLSVYLCGNDHYCVDVEVLPNACCSSGNVTATLYYWDRSGSTLTLSRAWTESWSLAPGTTYALVSIDTFVYTRIYEAIGVAATATCSSW